jgi:uncharacterized glyoxalase superfamily protein PhnB
VLIAATRYRDCEAALAFLTDVFGLAPRAVYRDDAGAIVHAELTLGTGMLMFGPEVPTEFAAYMVHPADTGRRATVSLYGVVPDVAAAYARAVAAGAEILIALRDEPHGGQSFSARDPEGHVWTFGSYDPFAAAG